MTDQARRVPVAPAVDDEAGTGPGPSLHVLYVAWGFPPHRGPGAYRSLATVNMLAAAGHRVTVLAADLATFDVMMGADRSLLERIHQDIRVIRVPFPAGRRDPIVSRWSRDRARAPKDWRDAMGVRESAVFPEFTYGLWRPRLDAAAYRLHRADPVDLTIATGNPYVDFSPAFHLGAEAGVPFVLDDRDAWLIDVYTGEALDPGGPAEQLCEAMMRRSAASWFVNEPIADWYRKRFPSIAGRISVVENGWDEAYLRVARIPRTPVPAKPVFGFIGTISTDLPVEDLLKAWRLARPRLGQGAELRLYGQIGHSGGGESDRLRLFAEHEHQGVRYLGRCPKGEIDEVYSQLDVLLFAKEGGSLVTSGKVYEYAATGKPIVCGIARQHDARRVLAAYPRRHDPVDLQPASLADAYVSAWQDALTAQDTVVDAALAAGSALRRDRLLGPALDGVIENLGTFAKELSR